MERGQSCDFEAVLGRTVERPLEHASRIPFDPAEQVPSRRTHPQQVVAAVVRGPDHHARFPQQRSRPLDRLCIQFGDVGANHHHPVVSLLEQVQERLMHALAEV